MSLVQSYSPSPPNGAGTPSPAGASDREMLDSLVTQVELFHAERHAWDEREKAAREMVASLEAQVASLLEERHDLEHDLERLERSAERAEERGRQLVTDLAEAAVAVD